MKFLAVITLLILTITLAQPAAAQTFQPNFRAGTAARDRKDYATALKHFRPLAKQGYVRAQNGLGWMYEQGRGHYFIALLAKAIGNFLIVFLDGVVGSNTETDNCANDCPGDQSLTAASRRAV